MCDRDDDDRRQVLDERRRDRVGGLDEVEVRVLDADLAYPPLPFSPTFIFLLLHERCAQSRLLAGVLIFPFSLSFRSFSPTFIIPPLPHPFPLQLVPSYIS